MRRGPAFALLIAVTTACSGSSAAPSTAPAAVQLTGTITDPAGDSLRNPSLVPISPDLVSATIDVAGGSLTLNVSFAPGTLSPDTVFYATLDTDENPRTGRPGLAGGPLGTVDTDLLGVDYEIAGNYPRRSNLATVFRVTAAPPVQPTIIGTVPLTFPAPDRARVVVPLSMLGNDDGRMTFKVVCQQWLTDSSTTITAFGSFMDYMPDVGLPPGTVR